MGLETDGSKVRGWEFRGEQGTSANDAGLHIERMGTSAAREGGSGGGQVGGGQQVRRGLVFVGQVLAAGERTTGPYTRLHTKLYRTVYPLQLGEFGYPRNSGRWGGEASSDGNRGRLRAVQRCVQRC